MSRKHTACCVLVQVGTVDGHGYDGQQEDAICDVRGSWQTIQSTFKPVYCWFRLIGYAYKLLRCLDLEIWQFLWWQQTETDRQTNYFTPVHACGVNIAQGSCRDGIYNTRRTLVLVLSGPSHTRKGLSSMHGCAHINPTIEIWKSKYSYMYFWSIHSS